MKKLTLNDIYDLVNSIQAPTFNTKGQTISFQFITDNRFDSSYKILPHLKSMLKTFTTQATSLGLSFHCSRIRKLSWPQPEPCTQYRVTITIIKPKYAKATK